MSSIAPQINTYTNSTEMTEMSENEDVMIEIRDNIPVSTNIGLVKEWDDFIRGKEVTNRFDRKRRIERVPPLLKKGEKGCKNKEYYEPAVVSLGPYHHNQPKLVQAEKYKLITLEEFRMSCRKTIGHLYNKVFEVVEDARTCYIDGSTDGYTDEEFIRMLLRDACFVLFFIDCVSSASSKLLLNNEYLGALGFANVARDIFLLENQIPFVVFEVLLGIRYCDKGEDTLNRFFNYLNYGEVMNRNEKVLENKNPLHLLELYRSYFISLPASLGLGSTHSTGSTMWRMWNKETKHTYDDYNYVKRNRSFASVMELKAKGVFLKSIDNESSNEDIKFVSHCCYGELELVRRAVSTNTKAIYLNMIAYEMCAHNPNDFRISTYIRVMKSLIIQRDDVKELRNNNILLHSLGRDEDVVKMYDEIEAPAVNLYMFSQLRWEIEKHCKSKYKTWAAELMNVYFSSPWKTMALLVASAILFTSFLQTYFAIRPPPDDSNADTIKLLRQCIYHLKPPTKPA